MCYKLNCINYNFILYNTFEFMTLSTLLWKFSCLQVSCSHSHLRWNQVPPRTVCPLRFFSPLGWRASLSGEGGDLDKYHFSQGQKGVLLCLVRLQEPVLASSVSFVFSPIHLACPLMSQVLLAPSNPQTKSPPASPIRSPLISAVALARLQASLIEVQPPP